MTTIIHAWDEVVTDVMFN